MKKYFCFFISGDKLTDSATLSTKMAVHAGNAFTIFSDSFQKVTASNPVSGSATMNSVVRNNKVSNPSVQFTTGTYCTVVHR